MKLTATKVLDPLCSSAPNQPWPAWAVAVQARITALDNAFSTNGVTVPELAQTHLAHLADVATEIAEDKDNQKAARNWATTKMPIFVYIADYPEPNRLHHPFPVHDPCS